MKNNDDNHECMCGGQCGSCGNCDDKSSTEHSLSPYSKLSQGTNPPEEINIVIEIPQGSSTKYQMDEETGLLFVDRFVPPAMFFPINYGFIPHTLGDDGDAIDAVVLTSYPVHPGVVIPSRPIGLLEMEDEDGIDTKIIAVPMPKVDFYHQYIKDVDDLNETHKAQIKHFFEHYKDLEPGKWVKIKNYLPKKDALKAIINATLK